MKRVLFNIPLKFQMKSDADLVTYFKEINREVVYSQTSIPTMNPDLGQQDPYPNQGVSRAHLHDSLMLPVADDEIKSPFVQTLYALIEMGSYQNYDNS